MAPFLAAACIALLALQGCGAEQSIVRFEGAAHASISKATLDHWMKAMVGSDFRRSVATEGPVGLASEPADYSRCVDAAKLVAPRSFFNQLRPSRVELTEKCHQIYRTIKAQALSFLISAQWTLAEAAEQGISVSNAEVLRHFAQVRKGEYPTEAQLRKYLAERQLSLEDLLYQFKVNMLVTRLLPRFERQVRSAGGGERAYAKLALEHYQGIIAKTSCAKGYLVPGCSAYHGPPSVSPSPDVVLKRLVGRT